MSAKSNWAENAVLDWLLGGASPTRPSARYLALHTADPGETGATGEVSGSGYARQAVTFGAAASGAVANTSEHDFTASGGAWGTITHFSIWDASTSGNCIYYGALAVSRAIGDGETGTVAAGDIDITEA